MLEFALLGLLQQSPMHGYELRKELAQVLGGLRSISFGSLYPALKRLHAAGWITTCEPGPGTPLPADAPPLTGRRGKVVYTITAEGKERFHELAGQSIPRADEMVVVSIAGVSAIHAVRGSPVHVVAEIGDDQGELRQPRGVETRQRLDMGRVAWEVQKRHVLLREARRPRARRARRSVRRRAPRRPRVGTRPYRFRRPIQHHRRRSRERSATDSCARCLPTRTPSRE